MSDSRRPFDSSPKQIPNRVVSAKVLSETYIHLAAAALFFFLLCCAVQRQRRPKRRRPCRNAVVVQRAAAQRRAKLNRGQGLR